MPTKIVPLRPSTKFVYDDLTISQEAYSFLRSVALVLSQEPTPSGGHLAGTATNTDIINKINLIIDALIARGVMT